ncbi:hypothetical protein GCM10023145_10590 [Angustibacter luteus]
MTRYRGKVGPVMALVLLVLVGIAVYLLAHSRPVIEDDVTGAAGSALARENHHASRL